MGGSWPWAVLPAEGAGCALPISAVDATLRAERNLVYIGVAKDDIPVTITLPIDWDVNTVTVGDTAYAAAAMVAVFPDGDRLAALMTTTWTFEHLLFWHQPFSSRAGLPDLTVWTTQGLATAAMTHPDWTLNAP